jgi:alpha-tubulin suppressor-like RCC1 family protein
MPNYSGKWKLPTVMQAEGADNWPVRPFELWAWGHGGSGGLGQGNTTNYSSPVQVGALIDWSTIAIGTQNGFALKTDGTIWSWGRNNLGQLGHNNTTAISSPVQIGALTTWLELSAGYYHAVAIKADGTLWGWGRNNKGNLGQGNTTNYSSPVQVGALTDWLQVAAGYGMTLAVKTDGTLWAIGSNYAGQLGFGAEGAHVSSPVQVGALTNWSKVTCGQWYTMAIKTDGTIWAWGEANSGQLGDGTVVDKSSPVQVGALTTWSKISAGGEGTTGISMAIKTDGTLWAWGNNGKGALGDGSLTSRSSPVQIGALTTWAECCPGAEHSTVLQTDGTLWGMGYNAFGQLGNGNITQYSSPVQVGALTSWSVLPNSNLGSQTMAIKN